MQVGVQFCTPFSSHQVSLKITTSQTTLPTNNIMAIKLQNQKLKILGARQASIFHAQAPQNLKHKNGLSHVWLPDRLLGPYHGLANLRLHMLLMGRVLAFLAAETTAAQF